MVNRIDMLVEGGQVVAGGVVSEATIAISEGKIAALLAPGVVPPAAAGAERIDASGMIVIPGVIDSHVHVTNFDSQADSFATASVAAAHGGVTTIVPYIGGKKGMAVRQFLTHFREEGEAQSVVDFAMHCRLGSPEKGSTRAYDEAFEQGVTSFKLYMAYRKRGIMCDDYSLFEALSYLGMRGGVLCCHAENGDIADYLEDRLLAEGRYTPDNYLAARPHEVEVEAIFRVLTIARLARCHLHLAHVSTSEGLDLAHRSFTAGQRVTVESCPHYLTLSHDETARQGGRTKIAPPLRTKKDIGDLWRGVAAGAVTTLASDHAPGSPENKQLSPEQFSEISFGMPGVETLLPVVYSEGVAKGRIDLTRLVELLCESPARTFGLAPRKGSIAIGADADLVLVDPDVKWVLRPEDVHSRAGYSAFEGWALHGKPVVTIVRGQVVVRDGRLVASHGFGRYLPRYEVSSE